MNIEEMFRFLVKEYHLNYSHQLFYHCYGGSWVVSTHSYYNETGCFTIHFLHQRDEFDFYYSKEVSLTREALCERKIDVQSVCPEIWFEAKKRFLFAYRPKLYFKTLACVIKQEIKEKKSFFWNKYLLI